MNDQISEDSLDRAIAACAWLVDVAQRSVDRYGWDPVIVRYLEQLGQGAHEAQLSGRGGMGAVAPMERSVAAVKVCAHLDVCRGTSRSSCGASVACHEKQGRVGGELLQ